MEIWSGSEICEGTFDLVRSSGQVIPAEIYCRFVYRLNIVDRIIACAEIGVDTLEVVGITGAHLEKDFLGEKEIAQIEEQMVNYIRRKYESGLLKPAFVEHDELKLE